MHLTLHVDWRGRKRRLILPLWALAAVVLSYGALAAAIGGWGSNPQTADAKVWQAALSVAGEELLRVRSESAARVETLTDGLSQLQAQASRLQILGDRVVREARRLAGAGRQDLLQLRLSARSASRRPPLPCRRRHPRPQG